MTNKKFADVASPELQQNTPPDAPLSPHSSAASGVTWRAFLLGLPLLVGISILSVYADMSSQVVQLGVMQLAPPAVAALLFLALVNRGLSRLLRREWLGKGDLIAIYSMLLVGVLVSTRGVTEKLIPPLAYLPYFATRENNLNQILTQNLPAWAMPFVPSPQAGPPPEVIKGFWEGHSSVPWSAWLGPMCAWFGLIVCVLWVFLCLATILRRQWMDNEQLRFPLARLPLAILHNEIEGQPFFSNRGMWIGFGISCFVFGLNGLHANFPDWPSVQLTLDLGPMLTEKPWNAMQNPPIFLSLAAIGFAYFLPLDLLFSMWFFYLMTRAQDVLAAVLGGHPSGIGTHGTNAFQGYQAAGAYLVLVVAQLRIGWPYFKQVFAAAWGKSTLDDRDELMSYRVAVWGLIAGFGGIVLWLSLAGMNPLFAAAQMGLFLFFIALMMSRAVCEAGFLGTETSFLPSHLINLVYPLPGLGAHNLTMMD